MADCPRSYTMAAEAAAEILSYKLDILLSRPELVGCFPMETLVKHAKANLATIQKFFSSKGRPSKNAEWAGRLLRLLYDAEEFIGKFHIKVARGRHEALHAATRPLATLVHKYMLWRDMCNVVKAMEELCQDQHLPDKEAGHETKKEPASAPWEGKKFARLANFWYRQESMNLLCHETKKEDLKKRIRMESKEVHPILIWGEQGAGKTFLARWVYREAMYLGFDTRAWVHVPAINDQREFLFEILKQVDKLARATMNVDEIKEMLSQKLASENRFLLVLDDVRWSDLELLEELATIIQPLSWQGHIIITTPDQRMAGFTSDKLEELGDDESQRMLGMKLRRGPQGGEDKILKRIPALPLCICLLGGLLSYATEEERAALVNNHSKISVPDLLELNYHRLPVHLKPCFIYMALFPVASPIPTRRLVRLWLAEGLLDSHCCNRGTETTPEEVGQTFILELADRNVIDVVSWRADGSPKACQMLTSLYDLIFPVAISMGFLHIHYSRRSRGRNELNPTGWQQQLPDALPEKTKCRWLVEHTNIVSSGYYSSQPYLKLGHVHSFLSFYIKRGIRSENIGTLLTKMTSKVDYSLLRVLDLEGVYQPSLQGLLRKLVLLRYLGLRSTLLDSIPREVADLQYLETLDIKGTNITSLPSSLWKARNLRHLHLNWFYMDSKKILKACRNNPTALAKLQTLSGLVIGEGKENTVMAPTNVDSFTTLTKLRILLQHFGSDTSGTARKTVANWISSKLTNLQSLTFGVVQEANPAEGSTKVEKPDKEDKPAEEDMRKAKRSEGAKPARSRIGPLPELSLVGKHHKLLEFYLLGQLNKPSWEQLLPVSLRVLTLSGSRVVEEAMMPRLGGLLRNLRTLRLLANSFLGTGLTFAEDGIPRLMTLKIWKLPQIDKVVIKQGAMPHLKFLEFRRLDGMNNVEGIKECKELEKICAVVKKGARDFVDRVKDEIGETYMYKIKEIPGSTDDNEDNRYKKGKMPSPHVEKDTTDRDEKGEIFHLHIDRDIKRPAYIDDDDSPDDDGDTLP